ncbi:MAG: P1 family peptidase [Paracoccus sp. (in: a-proteobacteria)]|uniref:P1 family peptidase n=2 Tax=Paracoccus TaxID=265 RepID=UPI000C482E84|nr:MULTISPECIES: P1 family peptidase [unclassified Paracoccus (in: a-proteobacteria)]MAN56099.1 peptidase T4 [Paracoccus sp. (in: a-proteobacteria)]MBA50481.1 peptidase T4 [Paracoccus sp. (in: a-proteobacteria)]MCS5602409.1 P1 family peptidase [Paracoccus sp. (in: a-proteobacteria)]|tara:strand:+ start:1040 stop:2032 length:993 start_codon:yes stop_codon:yes gene_type:complete
MRSGPRNLISDVAGLRVGNAAEARLKSGVTVLTGDAPFTAAVQVMGGAPGSRETDLLAPDKLVTAVDALVLSGGSAFGLAACDGVMQALRAAGRGFAVGAARVPIVPGAIVFDLLNGGDKDWTENPYPALGRAAWQAAAPDFGIGSAGAGTGAMTGRLKGGLGSASAVLENGLTMGALVVVNAIGSATIGEGPHFWAAPWELEGEFGRGGLPRSFPAAQEPQPMKRQGEATTLAIVATDAALDKAALQRLAIAAHDGLARALVPSHTPMDGDLVFAVSTGARRVADPVAQVFGLGHAASCTLARAVARAIHAAEPAPGDLQPCWSVRFGA